MRTFQSGAGLLLNLISELRVRHLVLDFNTLPDISVYDQLWLGANWMPGLMKLPVERVVLVINRRRVMGIGDGVLEADGKPIYTAEDLRVGLYQRP